MAPRTHKPAKPPLATLTPRQKTIVTMIADGYTNRQIGEILGIALKTIECHRAHAMQRTGSASLAHLVRYAVRTGLVSMNPGERPMTALDNIFLIIDVAIEKDAIHREELRRVLAALREALDDGDNKDSLAVLALNDTLVQRFGQIVHGTPNMVRL